MLTLEQALEILGRVGSDTPPSAADLAAARDTMARELHALRAGGSTDLEALQSLRAAYDLAVQAATEAETAEAAASGDVDTLLDGVPNPDDAGDGTDLSGAGDDGAGEILPLRAAVERLFGTGAISDREPDSAGGDAGGDSVDELAAVTRTIDIGGRVTEDATLHDLALAFQGSSRGLKAGKERVARVTTEFAAARTLPGTIGGNTQLIDSLLSPEAVTAAGGCCSLPTPIYENPVYGSTARPIRDSLPVIGAARGKAVFYPAVCIPQAGSAIWTCEQDAAVDPEDPATWKECAEVECEDSDDADVYAIYRCLTIGNYQARFSPEQWEAHLKALLVSQARMSEVALFNAMRLNVTDGHIGLTTGSFYTNLVNTVALATASMRQDQRLSEVQFKLTGADWIKSAIAADWRVRGLNTGRDSVEGAAAQVASALADEGVTVVYSPDIDPIEAQTYDGELSSYPDFASVVLAPEGYNSFLDGGQFDLGTEIRDHSLNRQNKVAAFAEGFEGLLSRGCASMALDIPVEVCDEVPCPGVVTA